MPSLRVPINPQALSWAINRAGQKTDGLAKSCGVSEERVEAWLGGLEQPTYRQAQKIAERLRISLGQLLLPPPDREEIPLPDFRRGIAAQGQPSPELLETIYDALRKRDWWREYQGGRTLSFVGSMDWRKTTPEQVAEAIRDYIPFSELARSAGDAAGLLREAAKCAEEIGILVLRKGIVGSNTHRPLDPAEFSGFAVADPVAPIILINMKDFPRRRNFTFAHELAHIWLGESALDDNLEQQSETRLERFCDQVAAELVVPKDEILREWQGEPLEAAERVARRFWVSVWVAARRAYALGLIARGEYQLVIERYYRNLSKGILDDRERNASRGDVYRSLLSRNSPTFVRAVANRVTSGDLTYKEAASLVGVSIRTMIGFLEKRFDEVSS